MSWREIDEMVKRAEKNLEAAKEIAKAFAVASPNQGGVEVFLRPPGFWVAKWRGAGGRELVRTLETSGDKFIEKLTQALKLEQETAKRAEKKGPAK